MPLPAYGLLIGRVTASRPQTGGHPHWLVMVQPSITNHPPYRVAINLESTDPGAPPEIEYQIVDIAQDGTPALKALAANLQANGATDSFIVGDQLPALDFVRGDLLDPAATWLVPSDANPLKSPFQAALNEAIQADEADNALIAVFGTGYPINAATRKSPSTGYTGVDNIHMNQGAPNRVGAGSHYLENGADQDGGLIFLLPSGPKAFFVKFQTQSLNTDANGNPTDAQSAPIDNHLAAAMDTLRNDPTVTAVLAAAPPPAPGAAPPGPRHVFADPDPNDDTEQFEPDVDNAFNTPFVQQQAKGTVRGPVPDPRGDDVSLDLASVAGPAPPGYANVGGVESIQFDMIGDSGAVTAATQKGELAVGDLITQTAKASQPAFLYHVGDVVYYYGEKRYYYGQFAEVFKDYPAPIFAIPGNHDGLIYDPSQVSLETFMAAFCAETPAPWDGFGGIQRTTMTQPGVFFTLDAPLVSIVGLYSNCGESGGWVNDKQYAFLLGELTRLKAQRDAQQRAVILAIHHLPRWFPGHTDATSASIDAICVKAGLWPDAVVVGHAHLYERIVRPQGVGGAPRDLPYFINGGGGYKIVATQKTGGAYLDTLPSGDTVTIPEEGFLRVSVTKTSSAMTLQFGYMSTKHPDNGPVDRYAVTL